MSSQELTGIEAYKLGKALKIINDELEFYEDSRKKLFEQYCIKDEKGHVKINDKGQVQVAPDKIPIFNTEMEKINNIEIELNIPYLILEDLTNVKLTPQEAANLIWWIQ